MSTPCFFGYGSLVNRSTHSYPNATAATATGWRRAWVSTDLRPFAYLTAVPSTSSAVTGLMADVPGGDWAALDAREHGYERCNASGQVSHGRDTQPDVAIYAISPDKFRANREKLPVLLSYLDVVLQGYLQEFGVSGAEDFVDTTDGWDTPVTNDRAAPVYPRHQTLSEQEQDFVNATLKNLGHNP